MTDTVTLAREKAARAIAAAQRELEIAEALPTVEGFGAPLIVQQADGEAWICYRDPATFADILRVFDAFDGAPAYVTKAPGWAARVDREESDARETLVSDAFAWMQIDASTTTGTRVTFRRFATLANGIRAQVSVDISSGHWNRGARHPDLFAGFVNLKPRATRYPEYQCSAPRFLATAAQVFTAATGARDGSQGHWKGVYMTRECLAGALQTLES